MGLPELYGGHATMAAPFIKNDTCFLWQCE